MQTKLSLALPANLGGQLSQFWHGLSPQAQHRLIGAGVGGGLGLLSGGPDEHGETHRLRNMALGAGAGAAAGHYAGPGMANLMHGRTWGGAIPAGPGTLPLGHQLGAASEAFPKLSSAYEAGFDAALEKFAKALTAKGRDHIKKKNFALPKKEKYPIENEDHARNALSRVSQFGSPAEKAEVRSKVESKYPGIEVSKG